MKICVDAGHNYSGYDTGAEGYGLREQNVTFKIANILRGYFNYIGIQTVMTRKTSDANVGYNLQSSLLERAKIANDNDCDLFISLHCNSGVPNANGTETLICAKEGEAEKLAECIQTGIIQEVKTYNRGVRVDKEYLGYSLAVLNETEMPAVLVETAFISNEKDAALLEHSPEKIALGIFYGVRNYLEIDEQIKPDNNEDKELETVNDIVWELAHRGIIVNKDLWLEKLKTDTNAYWLARKCVNYIREIDI